MTNFYVLEQTSPWKDDFDKKSIQKSVKGNDSILCIAVSSFSLNAKPSVSATFLSRNESLQKYTLGFLLMNLTR